jgi:nicotinate-nucleotide pyrophosphorylase
MKPSPDVESYRETVRRALAEDLGSRRHHDHCDRSGGASRGQFLVKADCVVAGLEVAFEAFRLEPSVQVSVRKPDGAVRAW